MSIIDISYYINKLYLYFSDDYFQATVQAKKFENTSNVSSLSYETSDEIRTRQKKENTTSTSRTYTLENGSDTSTKHPTHGYI